MIISPLAGIFARMRLEAPEEFEKLRKILNKEAE